MHSHDTRATSANPSAVRVLVVDDSAFMRRLISETLAADPGIEVIGFAGDGVTALQEISRLHPDVVTLDVEMPGIDGLETLRQAREQNSRVRIIMFSSLTGRGAPVTLKALMLGASDYCAKPSGASPGEAREYLRRELIPRLRQFAKRPAATNLRAAALSQTSRPSRPPQAVLIGISTGGPQALASILPQIPADFPLPLLIVQHMPATFTRLFAQRLDSETKIRVEEAHDGQPVAPGLALLAPGGYHMRVKRQGSQVVALIGQEPPENSCRPAVDVLFRSAAETWGSGVLAAVLTGMGHDGLRGAEVLKQSGAYLIAQDEASSVVWGMPGAVANAGLADEVLDLRQIVPAILKRCGYRA